jgi:hypothetical protein
MVFWKAVPNNVIYRSTGTYTIPSGQLNFRIDNSEEIFLMSLESDRDYRHITDKEFTIPIEYDDSYSLLSHVEFGGVWLKAAIEIHAVNT